MISFIHPSICLSIYLSIYVPIYLSIYLSIYLFIYLSIYKQTSAVALNTGCGFSSFLSSLTPISTAGATRRDSEIGTMSYSNIQFSYQERQASSSSVPSYQLVLLQTNLCKRECAYIYTGSKLQGSESSNEEEHRYSWDLALFQVFSCLVAGQFVFTVMYRSKRVANNKQQTNKQTNNKHTKREDLGAFITQVDVRRGRSHIQVCTP